MKLNRILPCGIVAVAVISQCMLVNAACNGLKKCEDSSYTTPNPCTFMSGCSATVYSPDPCADCAAGGEKDDCSVVSYQTGSVTTYYHGLCADDGVCGNPTPGDPSPISCATAIIVDTQCGS